MTPSKTIGRELKDARERHTYTLRQVEELTEISNAYLSQLENDKIKKPSANVLYKLATLYKIDFDYLLAATGAIEYKPNAEGPKSLSGFALSSEDLSPEEEQELADYLKFLRSKKKNEK
jgi:HTH-type transcriptional regulator, competence development regulator